MTTIKQVDELLELAIAGDSVARVQIKTMLYQYIDLIDEMQGVIDSPNLAIHGGKVETLPKELRLILGDPIE